MIDLALDDSLFITDEFTEALQELDILFGTYPTELIGNVNYGTNFEKFLWSLTPNTDSLHKYIVNKINSETAFLKNSLYNISVDYYDDISENAYIVSIILYKDQDDKIGYSKKYILR